MKVKNILIVSSRIKMDAFFLLVSKPYFKVNGMSPILPASITERPALAEHYYRPMDFNYVH